MQFSSFQTFPAGTVTGVVLDAVKAMLMTWLNCKFPWALREPRIKKVNRKKIEKYLAFYNFQMLMIILEVTYNLTVVMALLMHLKIIIL